MKRIVLIFIVILTSFLSGCKNDMDHEVKLVTPEEMKAIMELEDVQLSARISASGEAMARSGDFESAPVDVATAPEVAAALLIDRVVK